MWFTTEEEKNISSISGRDPQLTTTYPYPNPWYLLKIKEIITDLGSVMVKEEIECQGAKGRGGIRWEERWGERGQGKGIKIIFLKQPKMKWPTKNHQSDALRPLIKALDKKLTYI